MLFQQTYMINLTTKFKERQELMILNNLKLSLKREFTPVSYIHFLQFYIILFFVSNIYLCIGLYTDISINIFTRYNKIKHCHSNIINRKTILSFKYMFFSFFSNHVIMIFHQFVLNMLFELGFFEIFTTDLGYFVFFNKDFGYWRPYNRPPFDSTEYRSVSVSRFTNTFTRNLSF